MYGARFLISPPLLAAAMVASTIVTTLRAVDKKPAKPKGPSFRISKETTYLTKPLDEDGYVDYAAALDAIASKGVTKGNNAAVPLAQILGPAKFEGTAKVFFGKLGVPVPPKEGTYFLTMYDFANQEAGEKADEYFYSLFQQQSKAASRVWSKKELPKVAVWLRQNRDALKAIRVAAHRKRWFNPIVGLPGNDRNLLVGASALNQGTRDFTRALTANALLAVGKGRIDEATADLLTCHRLARHISSGPSIVNYLQGVAIGAMTHRAEIAMLRSSRLSKKQLASYQSALQSLSPFSTVAEIYDRTGRFSVLDKVAAVSRRGYGRFKDYTNFSKVKGLKNLSLRVKWEALESLIDWNLVLKGVNDNFNRLKFVMKTRRFADWTVEWEKHHLHTSESALDFRRNKELFAKLLVERNKRRGAVSEALAHTMVSLLMSPVKPLKFAECRTKTRVRLTLLAIALERHRKAHGRFPAKLADLQPAFLKKLPRDLYTEKPFVYKPTKTGYLLYSVGPNRKDDGGKERGDGDADDIAVRMKIAK